jgi:hypothetical protein
MTLPIYDQAWDAFTRTPPRYHQPDTTSTTTPPETHVSLAQDIQNDIAELRTKISDAAAKVETIATDHLPAIVEKIDTAETNPVVQAVEAAVHVPPSYLASVAKSLLDLEDYLASKEAAAAPAPAADGDQAPQPNMQAGAEVSAAQ